MDKIMICFTNNIAITFSFGHNNLGSEGGKYIADALKVNTTLSLLW